MLFSAQSAVPPAIIDSLVALPDWFGSRMAIALDFKLSQSSLRPKKPLNLTCPPSTVPGMVTTILPNADTSFVW